MGKGMEVPLRFCPFSLASLVIVRVATGALIIFALLLPANAQFWGNSWGWPQEQRQRQYQPYGGYGSDRQGGFWGDRQWESPRYPRQREPERQRTREAERDQPPDYSHAPQATPRKDAAIKIVVMGDANADWLAYGLEDAFSEQPEVGIVRKHRTDSGLIRRDADWSQMAREIIAAEKPKFIVMMIGNNDRQTIRERISPTSGPRASPPPAQVSPLGTPVNKSVAADPEEQSRQQTEPAERANVSPEQARQASYGPWEFRTEKWERAYIKRIDATIAALKSAGIPVIWVGLPPQRGTNASTDSSYLNELYRSRAEKAGIVYVDIWDGFVDEAGKFSPQGPDHLGQIRRLRTGDGVYFTKFGARKLAHYVEREIEHNLSSQRVPVALPAPADREERGRKGKPSSPVRPAAGPVVPLTGANGGSEKVLLGGAGDIRPLGVDPVAVRVLSTGEAVAAPAGRADDFRWPRDDITTDRAAVQAGSRE